MDEMRRLMFRAFDVVFGLIVSLMEKELLPDFVIRFGIRQLLAARLAKEHQGGEEGYQRRLQGFVAELKSMPIAIQTESANEQHYEVPTSYFLLCLGKHLKYSSCLFPRLDPATALSDAEEAMLELCCSRAKLEDGQSVLELGCGWGSLCLYIAAKYPRSQVTAVSNSRTQKELIDFRAQQRGLTNLEVVTADVVDYQTTSKFDRVVSVEMFEHMKNYRLLLQKISGWMKPGSLLFIHFFCHRQYAYHFEVADESDWMAKHFFSGGTMPSANLLHFFQEDVIIQEQYWINGRHYSLTLEAWLRKQDSQRSAIMPIMQDTYGKGNALQWWVRWRVFYMACSELFRYNGGNEWGVTHLLFSKR